jgi:hypothetical protein
MDQLPTPEAMQELVARSQALANVRAQQSRMAPPETFALYLTDDFALGPPEAFIDGHEFCHLHGFPEGSIHLTLPRILRDEVVRLGWAERHPISRLGIMPALITVYGPRDRHETDIVLSLIAQSRDFAQGKLQVLEIEDGCLQEAC